MSFFVLTLLGGLTTLMAWRYAERLLDWIEPRVVEWASQAGPVMFSGARHFRAATIPLLAAAVAGAFVFLGWLTGNSPLVTALAALFTAAPIAAVAFGRFSNLALAALYTTVNLTLFVRLTSQISEDGIDWTWFAVSSWGVLMSVTFLGTALILFGRTRGLFVSRWTRASDGKGTVR
jgi:hypothetical protein